jgi:aminopeptidase S
MQLLANPGFDAGPTAWTQTTLSSSTIITHDSALMSIKGQTPSYLAWLGGYSNAQDDLFQMVTVPAGATAITLTFYYAIATQEVTSGAFDVLDVYTYDPAAARFTPVASFNDNMPVGTWTRFTVSLPLSLAGHTIQFGFRATTDVNKNTNFFVDSVSLDVTGCTP